MRALRATGRVFIVIGLTLLLFVAYEIVGTSQITNGHQSALAQDFDRRLRAGTPRPTIAPLPRQAIARLIIPSIDVRSIVVEGTRLADLSYGPGHYRQSLLPWDDGARPGKTGSTAIAGHRTGWGSPFINLDKLRRGDEIVLETTRGRYTYRVTRSTVVDPDATWVLDGDPRSVAPAKLTLTTCTPKYTALRRLIVWADRVGGPA